MPTSITKKDLTTLGENLEQSFKRGLTGLKENLEESFQEGIREVVHHFNDSQGVQNVQLKQITADLQLIKADLTQVNVKLEAIMSGEVLVTRKQLERLLHALKAKGIELNEVEILAA